MVLSDMMELAEQLGAKTAPPFAFEERAMDENARSHRTDAAAASRKAIRVTWLALRAFRAFFLILLAICLVALAIGAFRQPLLHWPTMAAFSQWALGALGYSLVLGQLMRVFGPIVKSEAPFLPGQGHRLRIAALLMILLMVTGMAFSYLSSVIAYHALPLPTLGFLLPGFPPAAVWDAMLNGGQIGGLAPALVTIDTTSLMAAGFLWGLSSVFDYGARLQQERVVPTTAPDDLITNR